MVCSKTSSDIVLILYAAAILLAIAALRAPLQKNNEKCSYGNSKATVYLFIAMSLLVVCAIIVSIDGIYIYRTREDSKVAVKKSLVLYWCFCWNPLLFLGFGTQPYVQTDNYGRHTAIIKCGQDALIMGIILACISAAMSQLLRDCCLKKEDGVEEEDC